MTWEGNNRGRTRHNRKESDASAKQAKCRGKRSCDCLFHEKSQGGPRLRETKLGKTESMTTIKETKEDEHENDGKPRAKPRKLHKSQSMDMGEHEKGFWL